MTTLEIVFVSGSIGILVGMGIMWIERLKLVRDRDEIEQRYLLETKGYVAHLDSHVCVVVPEEEEWPEEISFQ
jgi:hypothetical protein